MSESFFKGESLSGLCWHRLSAWEQRPWAMLLPHNSYLVDSVSSSQAVYTLFVTTSLNHGEPSTIGY